MKISFQHDNIALSMKAIDAWKQYFGHLAKDGEGESEVAALSTKRWNRRSSEALIESSTTCHDAHCTTTISRKKFEHGERRIFLTFIG